MSKWPELDEALGALLLPESDTTRVLDWHPSIEALDVYRNREALSAAKEKIRDHLVECIACADLLLAFSDSANLRDEFNCFLNGVARSSAGEKKDDSESGTGILEADLIERIHKAPSKEFISRYEQLSARRDSEQLSEAEARELLGLSDQVERMTVERLEALAVLARIHGVPLRLLAQEMGIKPIVNA